MVPQNNEREHTVCFSKRGFFCNAVTSSNEVCNDLTGQLSTWLVGFWKLL